MPKHIYDYENISFVLTIPTYWSTIYKGQPRRKLYDDYVAMLEWVKKVDKSKWIMDVGANHGIFSVPTSLLGYKVFGFEPVRSNYDNLYEAAIENNLKDFKMFPLALSNENGVKEIYIPECLDNSSFSADAAVANMIRKDCVAENVFTVKFDDWIKDYPQYADIGFIKIDTQGAEWIVISGMQDFLTQAHDIYLEVEYESHLEKQGHTFKELDELILSYGFEYRGKIGNDKIFYKP